MPMHGRKILVIAFTSPAHSREQRAISLFAQAELR
jgi:hypothetical protein